MVADQHRALDPRAVHQDADVGVDRVLTVKEGVHLNAMVMKMLFKYQTSQKLRMLSSVTINCQITKIVMNSGSQLSEF